MTEHAPTPWFRDGRLRFAVGLEDTFIPQVRPGERTLDEYELTQHYRHWRADLDKAEESGASMIRWGIPWYKVNPAKGVWDWRWLDEVVQHLAESALEPMVDLMHYGTPMWLADQFANPAYPEAVAEYAGAVAGRYRGALSVYTPLNEPLLNALHCGEYGYWPPYREGSRGLVELARALSRGIVLTQQAVAAAAPEATFVHVEASFRFESDAPEHAESVRHLRERAFLMQDLVMGRVDGDHPLVPFLSRNGFTDGDLTWAREHTAVPDVMGVNYYPAVSTEHLPAGMHVSGRPDDQWPRLDAGTDGLEDVLIAYAKRYGLPVFLTETCLPGSVQERLDWLDESVACVQALRSSGVDVIGYTWWAVIDMMEWTYRHGQKPPIAYRIPMGLWSLEEDPTGDLRRVRTPVADRFRHHALALGR